jgi:hypothetical protein
MAGSIFIPLISVFDGKGVRDAKSGMSALLGSVKHLKGAAIAAAAAFATVGAANFVKDAVTAARDLDRNMVGLNNVFGDISPGMEKFSKDAAAIGLSQIEASKASTFLGSVLKQSGFEMGDVAVETKNLVGLASDLAATYGYDVSEALTGMTALFRGEYDPIEKFGVAMKQSEVNALLAARGQNKLTGATLRQATAQARLDILYNRSQDAQASYAQQSDSLFVAQKNLQASFENIKASLGASLTQPLANLLQVMQPIVDTLGEKMTPYFDVLTRVVTMLTPVLDAMAQQFFAVVEAVTPIVDVLFMLIEPLMIPLAGVFKLIATAVKMLVPWITFLANLLGAILAPVIWVVTMALRILVEGLQFLLDSLAAIPGIGDVFKGINAGLKDFSQRILDSTDKTDGLNGATNEMTALLSKKLPLNNIDGLGKSAENAGKKIRGTNQYLEDLLKMAQGIQSSIMSTFDVNNVMGDVSDGIVESVTFVNGKFQTVVDGVSETSKNIVTGFQDNLAKIKSFYRSLRLLIKAGLDPVLLKQITDAGPIAGAATAEAILASGQEGIDALTKTSKDIRKISGDVGYTVAKNFMDSNQDIGNGLIDPLIAMLKGLNGSGLNAAAAAAGASAGEALVDGMAKAVEKTAAEKLASGEIGFGEFVNILSKSKPLSTPKPKPTPLFSNMSSLFKQGTGPLAPLAVKPGKDGMYSFMPNQIVNPYNQKTQANQWASFQNTKNNVAPQYNIVVNVPYGATDAEIGRALIKKIQSYEKTNGKTWRG